jgi:hypothetical protein
VHNHLLSKPLDNNIANPVLASFSNDYALYLAVSLANICLIYLYINIAEWEKMLQNTGSNLKYFNAWQPQELEDEANSEQ